MVGSIQSKHSKESVERLLGFMREANHKSKPVQHDMPRNIRMRRLAAMNDEELYIAAEKLRQERLELAEKLAEEGLLDPAWLEEEKKNSLFQAPSSEKQA